VRREVKVVGRTTSARSYPCWHEERFKEDSAIVDVGVSFQASEGDGGVVMPALDPFEDEDEDDIRCVCVTLLVFHSGGTE